LVNYHVEMTSRLSSRAKAAIGILNSINQIRLLNFARTGASLRRSETHRAQFLVLRRRSPSPQPQCRRSTVRVHPDACSFSYTGLARAILHFTAVKSRDRGTAFPSSETVRFRACIRSCRCRCESPTMWGSMGTKAKPLAPHELTASLSLRRCPHAASRRGGGRSHVGTAARRVGLQIWQTGNTATLPVAPVALDRSLPALISSEVRGPPSSDLSSMRLSVMTFGILGVAVVAGQPAPVTAKEYPWCTQGDTLQCWYMTREQCEEAVDYHGFCVANSNVPTLNNEAPQPRLRRPIQGSHYRR
jgi:hypothetical protein